MVEHRQIVRKHVKIPMKISLFEEGREDKVFIELEGNTKDISINGFGLEVKISSDKIWGKLKDFNPDTGKVFLMHLEILSPEKKLVADGTIVWCHVIDLEKKELQIGMFLKKMDAEIREEWSRFVKEL